MRMRPMVPTRHWNWPHRVWKAVMGRDSCVELHLPEAVKRVGGGEVHRAIEGLVHLCGARQRVAVHAVAVLR